MGCPNISDAVGNVFNIFFLEGREVQRGGASRMRSEVTSVDRGKRVTEGAAVRLRQTFFFCGCTWQRIVETVSQSWEGFGMGNVGEGCQGGGVGAE